MLTNDAINNLKTVGFSQEDFQIMSEILLKADGPDKSRQDKGPEPIAARDCCTTLRPESRFASNRNAMTATQKN